MRWFLVGRPNVGQSWTAHEWHSRRSLDKGDKFGSRQKGRNMGSFTAYQCKWGASLVGKDRLLFGKEGAHAFSCIVGFEDRFAERQRSLDGVRFVGVK